MDPHSGSNHQYSLIVDEIYSQKLSFLSSKVKNWLQNKEQFMNVNYRKSIDEIFVQLKIQHHKFQQRIHELLRIVSSEFQMVSKVKSTNEEIIHKKNHNVLGQNFLAKQEMLIFQNTLQKSYKKSSDIEQLSEFSSRFFAIISTQLNEFKSFSTQIQNRRQRFVYDLKKQVVQENKTIEEICIKNEAKYFYLKKFLKLKQSLEKQIKIFQKADEDTLNYYSQSLAKRKRILQDCVDNMSRFEQIYTKIFCCNFTQQISQHFTKLIDSINCLRIQHQVKGKQLQGQKDKVKNKLQRLYQENNQILRQLLQEITIGQWRHVSLSLTKKSSFSSFSSMGFSSRAHPREEISSDMTSKQMSFQAPSQPILYILNLTIDYKLIFRKQSQRNNISKQYLLNDLKIKQQKQGKVTDKVLILKDKKQKENLNIGFINNDKKEQFTLHLERFEQLKNSLKK